MRFSRYVQLDQVCCTLMEAVDYIQGHDDSDLCRELLNNGAQMLRDFYTVLMQFQSDWKNTKTKELLDEIICKWQDPLPDTIKERLEELRISLKEDIVIQIRAVFFAELGGKWDSMESVYSYMCQDPRFDPVVVLTPIFRAIKVDGETKSEIVYDDYLTPMGIPFYNYRDYSIEQDCPELAFTSQPYESVTLPEYWAQNIAQYTRLVYLPYFIPYMMYSDSRTTLCQMPIYSYAWRVAGSSEKFAQYYEKYSFCRGSNLMVTGIPKMDYAVQLKEAPRAVPEAWRPKVEGRTVILWNTWFIWNASSLQILEQIVPWLTEHKEFALIWRPHPMSWSVLKLYAPEHYKRFEMLLKAVNATENMIVDTEPEYAFAFSCSDAQISDFSSMMTQYLLLDKPLLWMNIPGKSLQVVESEDQMVSNRWMEQASNISDVLDFLGRIKNGEDRNRALRAEVCQEDLQMADGHAAQRICDTLWKDLVQETIQ